MSDTPPTPPPAVDYVEPPPAVSPAGAAEPPAVAAPPPPSPPPASAAPAPPANDLEGLPTFNFRELRPDEDPEVPFAFQGQKFTLHPGRVNALVLQDMPGIKISMDSRPMWELLEGLLGPDYERFYAKIRDPKIVIDAEGFAGLVRWMVGAAGGRPT